MPLKVYLADLTHMGSGVATEAFPLNIGLIASYAKKRFRHEVTVRLFKYPEDLREALVNDPPHVLGCSNYTWNANLAYHFVQLAKSLNRDTITVFGGTNYPFSPEKQHQFLVAHPQLNVHTFYEGELAFASLLERYLSVPISQLWQEPIQGCHFLERAGGTLCTGPSHERIKDLDAIDSPYASGLLDQFFDGKLTPLLETARGCPFTCNFCNAGNAYFNRVNQFSDAYVRHEWEYVARKASAADVGHLTLTDNNFGMIPRDAKTAQLMHELKERFGWPRSVTAWTGKNSKQRVIDVTRLLGETLSINMAVQSMDPMVLGQIKRSNIRIEDYQAVANELNAQGRPQLAEVIVPLPGETLASHVAGVNKLLDSNLSTVIVHTLQMLYGTPYKDSDAYVREYGFLRKYRIVPLDFGRYEGTPVFDTEEVAVATNTFSFEDYVASRRLLLVIDLCYNGTIFEVLKCYVRSKGMKISEWIHTLYDRLGTLPPAVETIVDSFTAETRSELWDTEANLVAHYSKPAHYEQLIRGEAGGNVLYKHKTWMMCEAGSSWIETVFAVSAELLRERLGPGAWQEEQEDLAELKKFVLCSIAEAFELRPEYPARRETFDVDLPAWLVDKTAPPLAAYRRSSPLTLEFAFQGDQLFMRQDALRRYGANRSGMVKLIQRLGDMGRCLRRASYVGRSQRRTALVGEAAGGG